MTASVFGKLASIRVNLLKEAKEKGFSPTKSITLILTGSNIQGDLACPKRKVIVSQGQPPANNKEAVIWITPASISVMKWAPVTSTWSRVIDSTDLFT